MGSILIVVKFKNFKKIVPYSVSMCRDTYILIRVYTVEKNYTLSAHVATT